MSEKLQKVLAGLGLGSRREIERWIQQGRVSVGTQTAKLGDRVDCHAKLFVDGKAIRLPTATHFVRRILLYYKPEGEVCTRHDPENRPTVFSHLPLLKAQRWIMVGRLDINTSGLLLFTNDGQLAQRLLHPSYEIEREYAVRVLGQVDTGLLKRLTQGVELEDGRASFARIEERGGKGSNHWYHVVLKEGRKHEVKRLFASQGLVVSRLIRIRFGNIHLPLDLKRGQWRELPAEYFLSE
jgi:23S rRNA pseudouridine2605 synthase